MTLQAVGRYEIIGLLGQGGIGQVYEARDSQLGRIVAIKALRPEYSADQAFLARFHAEAANLANLSHPNITTLYDLLPLDDQLYMVMELVRGHTLEAVLARCKQLGVREALAIIAQTAAGLSYAHSKDVIHRDIKPSNLMLTESGLLKIMDFGIARVRGSQRLTRAGSIVGTLFYVAPEQIKGGEGDEQSDVYSLGCVLYEMLSGDPPFRSESDYDLIRAHVEAAPAPLIERIPALPAPVEQALMRALAKKPEERFASVEEFSRALGAEAIQGQAADIVRADVFPLAGPLISQGLRGRPAEFGAVGKLAMPSGQLPGQAPRPGSMVQSGDPARAHSNHMPAIVLASTVALLSVGLIYVLGPDLWSALVQSNPQVTSSHHGSASDRLPSTEPKHSIVTATTQPRAGSAPTTDNDSTSNPNVELSQRDVGLFVGNGDNDKKQQTTPNGAGLVLESAPAQGSHIAPARGSLPTPSPGPPVERPAYQGRVANWMNADSLWVWDEDGKGAQPLHLYGIVSAPTPAEAKRDREQLMAFINAAGRVVTCYSRGIKFQCFAGAQDIALWAVKHGLAQLTDDAPAEYRNAEAAR